MIEIQGEVRLKKDKDHSIRRFHPWVFSGAIQTKSQLLSEGCWVRVLAHNGSILGHGHYQSGSITVRLLSFGEGIPSKDFWIEKLQAALSLRHAIGLYDSSTTVFRLIHGEGDGLPGLIVDYYNGAVVMQAHSIGMHLERHTIAQALQQLFKDSLVCVYYKSQGTLPNTLQSEVQAEYLIGHCPVPHVVEEYSHRFLIDWESGQKTGFFIDQRENRKALANLVKGKTVLNTFCYTGGFSIYAIKGEATIVHSVDASQKAIDLTRKNIELNGFDPSHHECYAADTFEFLKGKENQYDIIVLDPPAFAKHRDARHQAVKGYQRLNAEALRVIRKGGFLLTFSCSQVVDRKLFYDTIVSSAIQVGRDVRMLAFMSQPADHPVSVFHPEGEYLKGLLLYVE